MRFQFDGKTYNIGFDRKHLHVDVFENRKKKSVLSKYPFTTATLYERREGQPIASTVASATVGCVPTDPYSNQSGRLQALKALTQILTARKFSKEFKRTLWKAYADRGKAPVVEGTVIPAEQS